MRTILLLIAIPFCLSAQVLGPFGNNMHGGSAYDAIKYQNKLYVGGLSMMNNVTVGGTAVYDGTTTAAFAGGETRAFTIHNSNLYLAGKFNNQVLVKQFDGTNLSNYTTPLLNVNDVIVKDIEFYNGELYLSGVFTQNNNHYLLAKYDGNNWSFFGQVPFGQLATTINHYAGQLMVCGGFDTLNGMACNSVASFNGINWNLLNGGPPDKSVFYSSVSHNQEWIVAGRKRQVLGYGIYTWNGSSWQPKTFPNMNTAIISKVFKEENEIFYEFGLTPLTSPDRFRFMLYLESSNGLIQLSDTCVHTIGFFAGPVVFFHGVVHYNNEWIAYGSFYQVSPGSNPTFYPNLARINGILSNEENSMPNPQFAFYPNPTRDFLNLDLSAENTPYSIYNLQGVRVQNGTTSGQLHMSELPSGIYILQIEQNGRIARQRFVKVD